MIAPRAGKIWAHLNSIGRASGLHRCTARSPSSQSPPRGLFPFPSSAMDDGMFRRSSDNLSQRGRRMSYCKYLLGMTAALAAGGLIQAVTVVGQSKLGATQAPTKARSAVQAPSPVQ